MLLDEAIRELVRDVVRQVLREELQALQQPQPVEQDLLPLAKAAELVGVSISTIKGWLSSGALKRFGVGRIVRVSRAQLLAHLEPKPPQPIDAQALNRLAAKYIAKRAR